MSIEQLNLEQLHDRLLEPVLEATAMSAPRLSSLAHFTSHAVLEGIVKGEELWFSKVSEMNDVQEVQAGKDLIHEFATDETLIGRSMYAIEAWAPELWEEMRSDFNTRRQSDFDDTFISCWSAVYGYGCEAHDDLTMWRAYGGEGKGVAVVIDPRKIHIGHGALEITACPVFYETEDQFHQRAANYFRTFAINLLSLSISRPFSEASKETIIDAFSQLCFYLAVTHKHPGFAAENEWRFVWTKNRQTEDALDRFLKGVRVGDRTAQKFCLPLNRSEEFAYAPFNLRDVVTNVIIGPSDRAASNVIGVRQLLNDNDYDPAYTSVWASRIPYRTPT